MKKHLNSLIDREQADFRSRSSGTDHINTLRIIVELWAEIDLSLHLVFIYFEKTFDSEQGVYLRCSTQESFHHMRTKYIRCYIEIKSQRNFLKPEFVSAAFIITKRKLLVIGNCLENVEGFNGRWHVSSNNSTKMMISICILTE